MKRKRLLRQIYAPIILVIIISIFSSTWYAADTLKYISIEQTKGDLTIRAGLINKLIIGPFLSHDYEQMNKLCRQISRESATRITVIHQSGRILVDTLENEKKIDNFTNSLEVRQALRGDVGSSIRFSNSTNQKMLYIAVPLLLPAQKSIPAPEVRGILRLSIPTTLIDKTLHKVLIKIFFGALFFVLIAAVITLTTSRKITAPLEEMSSYAEQLAQENFTNTSLVPDIDTSTEIAGLANSLNTMAIQLHDRFQLLTKQKNELEAVFFSMVEAVIVVDINEKIIRMNHAATQFLGFAPNTIKDMKSLESHANMEMVTFVRRVLSMGRHLEEEIILNEGQNEIYLQAHGTLLYDAQNKSIGALIVLHDVTRLRNLENMRRDFVANVSHELRTPITTIKGFVETLQDGALSCPEDAQRFLTIILKHADRLNAIVDDLLTLSRLEQDGKKQEIILRTGFVNTILANSVETCSPKAQEKNITLSIKCPDELTLKMDESLLEQAIINLVINAIKYSHEDSEVYIRATQKGNEVTISIEDSGIGIAQEHLPRLFERFYRSDKARSRKLGGTGLGLSIVKHIAQSHNGIVTVNSSLEKGSVFSLKIPV